MGRESVKESKTKEINEVFFVFYNCTNAGEKDIISNVTIEVYTSLYRIV